LGQRVARHGAGAEALKVIFDADLPTRRDTSALIHAATESGYGLKTPDTNVLFFRHDEVAAIVADLTVKRDEDDFERPTIDQALKNYWHERMA
jgi:hypothetical protein